MIQDNPLAPHNGMTLDEIAGEQAEDEEEYHSRFDPDHYSQCQPCYEDHLDFIQDEEDSARLDAMSEASELEDE